MKKIIIISGIIGAFATGNDANAQYLLSGKDAAKTITELSNDSVTKEARRTGNILLNRKFSEKFFAPNLPFNSALISQISQISFESSLGEQKASATIGTRFGTGHTLNFEAKQTFKEAPKQSVPLSLDGLSDESSIAGAYQYVFSRFKFDGVAIADTFYKIKRDQFLKKLRKKIPLCDLLEMKKDSVKTYFAILNRGGKIDTFELRSVIKPVCCDCDSIKDYAYVSFKKYKPTDEEDLAIHSLTYLGLDDEHKQMFQNYLKGCRKKILFFNVKGGTGKNSFDYVDSTSIKPKSEVLQSSYFKFSIGGFANWQWTGSDRKPRRIKSAFALSYQMTDGYEAAGDPVNYSYPVDTNGVMYLKDVALGAPVHKIFNKVSFEWRFSFEGFRTLNNFAVSPSISYGIEKEAIVFNLPVYFLKNKDENGKVTGLSGGVNLGYTTKTTGTPATFKDGFSASIFISAPFDLLKNL